MNPIDDEDICDITEGRPIGPLAMLVICVCLGIFVASLIRLVQLI